MVALDTREIFAAAAMAVVLQGGLQVVAGAGLGILVFTTLMIALAALGCTHIVRRVRHLASGVAAEQLRLERQGRCKRYYRPQGGSTVSTPSFGRADAWNHVLTAWRAVLAPDGESPMV